MLKIISLLKKRRYYFCLDILQAVRYTFCMDYLKKMSENGKRGSVKLREKLGDGYSFYMSKLAKRSHKNRRKPPVDNSS